MTHQIITNHFCDNTSPEEKPCTITSLYHQVQLEETEDSNEILRMDEDEERKIRKETGNRRDKETDE